MPQINSKQLWHKSDGIRYLVCWTAVFVFLWPSSFALAQWPAELIREILLRGQVDIKIGAALAPFVKRIVTGSSLGDCVRINRPYRPNCLTVIFVKPGGPSLTKNVCGYFGRKVIVCDSGFLTTELDRIRAITSSDDAELKKNLYRAFQEWVLAHEIGHAIAGHDVRHFLRANRPGDRKQAMNFHSQEVEADRIALKRGLIADTKIFQAMLVRVFNASYRADYFDTKEGNPPLNYDLSVQVPYRLYESHPHFTLRAASLLLLHKDFESNVRVSAKYFLNRISAAPGLLDEIGLDDNSTLEQGQWRLTCWPNCPSDAD